MKNIKWFLAFFLFCQGIIRRRKISLNLLLIFLLLNHSSINAQSKKVDYTISYDVSTSDYKSAHKSERNYSNFEKLELVKKIQEQDHIDIVVYENGEEETTINHMSTNKYLEWAKKPAKTKIDDRGIKVYDIQGNLIANIEHSPMAKEFMEDAKKQNKIKKKYEIPEIRTLNRSDLSEMMANRVQIKQTREGKMHMRKDNREILYDANNQETEEREFEGKELKSLSKRKFAKTRDNISYVVESSDISLIIQESGRKMYQFVNKSIRNYQIKKTLNTRQGSDSESGFINSEDKLFSIQPNPATDYVWINIPLSVEQKNVDFTVVDITGRVVIREKIQRGLKQLSIENLPKGVYLAQYSSEEGDKQLIRFVKQ